MEPLQEGRRDLIISSEFMCITELVRRLLTDPHYRSGFTPRWSLREQVDFVEYASTDLPIPIIVIQRKSIQSYTIIDGLERLHTIRLHMEGQLDVSAIQRKPFPREESATLKREYRHADLGPWHLENLHIDAKVLAVSTPDHLELVRKNLNRHRSA